MKVTPNKNIFRTFLGIALGLTIFSLYLNAISLLEPEQNLSKAIMVQFYVGDLLAMLLVLWGVLRRVKSKEGYWIGTRTVFFELINKRDAKWASWLTKSLLTYLLILGFVSFGFGFFGGVGGKAQYELWGLRTLTAFLLLFNFWNFKSVWGILLVKGYA
jgi:hypothetical protein